jgi:ABC-2 type transport system ATP-binding protein
LKPDFVEADQLTKTFPTAVGVVPWARKLGRVERRTALESVSFGVRRGELFGLLGTNGAGKSTILRILAGSIVPDQGTVRVGGIDARTAPLMLRRMVGLCCTDERSFYYRLSARRNLEYFGALTGLYGKPLRERIAAVVRAVDLEVDLDLRFDAFSSGMKQRLGIARALLGDPEVLIFDEPTRAVDPAHTASIRAFIRDELVGRCSKTVVLATNVLEEAWDLCDRIAVLRGGRIAAIAPPSQLDARPDAPLRYEIVVDRSDEGLFARTRAVPGLLELRVSGDAQVVLLDVLLAREPRALTELLRAVSANGACVTSVRPQEPRPAEIFAGLVSERRDVR